MYKEYRHILPTIGAEMRCGIHIPVDIDIIKMKDGVYDHRNASHVGEFHACEPCLILLFNT